MRIAQIMLAKGFGGAERSFVDLCAELVARGHDVLAVCEARGAARALLERIPGLRIATQRVWGAWDPLARRSLVHALRDHGSEVVQCHLARAAHLGGSAARALGLPTLAKTHNYVDLKYYRAIDLLVPTTTSQADYLRGQGIAPGRIATIPNFSRLRVTARESPPFSGPLRVLALGRFVEKKGFDVLLDALSSLPPHPIELTLAGDGPLRERLRLRAKDLPSNVNVHFSGWVEDVAPLFAASDLFVLPSRDEPFGIVVLEAMAAKVPIIATRTRGPLEILDATTAVLVDIGDVQALAQAIESVIRDRSGALDRAARAAAVYEQTYSAAAVIPRYEALYTQLTRGRK